MNTLFKFIPDRLKMEIRVIFTAFMAVHAGKAWFKPELIRMRETCAVFIGMTIRTHECPVI